MLMPTNFLDLRDKSSKETRVSSSSRASFVVRGYSAVVTLGNTPNVDILCSNQKGIRFAHIQVKQNLQRVGMQAMKNVGPTFFWVLEGIPLAGFGSPVAGPKFDSISNL